ncbi:RNA polymerase III subunit Rpc25-domain-containing protein [Gaertneriomyces semiglobifer]|nr:RNA polymerase III subunit Rpc25-domain-containing protein [Gaertneriomyces semiglobifer]
MFILSKLKDNVRVYPSDFYKPRIDAVTDELNKKYANKVLHNVGLCIRVWDILEVSDPIVHIVQDGSYQSTVTFRLVVFRPFKGEVLLGKILSNDPVTGVKVSVGFFDDIIIPPVFLQANSVFNEEEKVWVWQYDESAALYMDNEEPIRFRVESEQFVDVGPVRVVDGQQETRKPPFSIYASIAEAGLGCTSWWDSE